MKFNLGAVVVWLVVLFCVSTLVSFACEDLGITRNYHLAISAFSGAVVTWVFNKAFPLLEIKE